MHNPGSQLPPAVFMPSEEAVLVLETTILSRPKLFDRSRPTGRECFVAVADQNSTW